MGYTEEQEQVIDIRGTNVLVSAAAGSGKTAVVVERLIKQVIEEGVNINEILVVTFTKAAAREMKERIRDALESRLEEADRDDASCRHLEKQLSLLFAAPITTIDAFCLDVLKNNFNEIDIDPSFRVADEGELKMIRGDVMDELMEDRYSNGGENGEFYEFLERFSVGRSDEDIIEAIEKIHDFAVSRPDPRGFISSMTKIYEKNDIGEIEKSEIGAMIDLYVISKLRGLKGAMERAYDLAVSPCGPESYAEPFEEDIRMLDGLLSAGSLDGFFERLSASSFAKLSSKKSPDEDKEIRNSAKAVRDRAKSVFEGLQRSFARPGGSDILQELKESKKDMEMLSQLSMEFLERFEAEKKKRSLMDFTDIEHYALRILKKEQVQKRYRSFFKEIIVDEYQDSNRIQEEIFKAVSNGKNFFCVGDVKQSIYSFRDACPELFTDKYGEYTKSSSGELILLSKNFRSRSSVLDTTNAIFRNVMHSSVGGVEYDREAYLNYSNIYTAENPDDITEYMFVRYNSDSGLNGDDAEALSVAKRIHELVGSFDIEDRKTHELRKCRYGDIVILMRSLAGRDMGFAEILSANDIPVYLDNKSGYLLSEEIRTIINLLYVIDNPYQDIPLAGTLLSVFGGMDESELALIRAEKQDASLYEAVLLSAGAGNEKAGVFITKLEGYRKAASCLSMYELLSLIIKDHGYDDLVRAKKSGAVRLDNLNMLLYRASEFEKTSYKGLFRFIRYIEYMKKYEIDMKNPSGDDPDKDAVRLMTIHHSKGLEFPVVFICGMQRRFNETDLSKRLLTDDVLGAGTDLIDTKRRTKKRSFIKNLIALKKKNRMIGEELRILYVAMTRAEQKLILSASWPWDGVSSPDRFQTGKNPVTVFDATSHDSFIYLALCLDKEAGKYIKTVIYTPEDLALGAIKDAEDSILQKNDFLQKAGTYESEETKAIRDSICLSYPYENETSVPEKVSVSFIKHEAMEEAGVKISALSEEKTVPVPKFYSDDADDESPLLGALRGTAYHTLFEHLDLGRIENDDEVIEQICGLKHRGVLDEREAGSINAADITAFGRSDLAGRMKKADENGCLFREQPFVILVNADEVDPGYPHDQKIMVQGIIDAYFIEDGKAVIMDYKTDRAEEGYELKLKYKAQLDYYAKAIRQLTGMEVAEEIIYSVTLGEEIVVE